MQIHHVWRRIRGFRPASGSGASLGHDTQRCPADALKFFVSSTSTAWRRPVTPSVSRAAPSTAGRPPSRPKAATRPPWLHNLCSQEAKNPQHGSPPGERNPAATHPPPQQGQGQAPRAPWPLVCPARYCAAQRLDDRAHHRQSARQDAPRPRPHRQPRESPSPCGGTRRPENPSRSRPKPWRCRLLYPRAHPRRHAPLHRHLHRSGLALCLCRGATFQARPIHRPRP
jgi:hypothetical protein